MNLIKINQEQLVIKQFNKMRVVTFKDIDKVHQRPEGTASRNFRVNRNRFIKDIDYIEITSKKFQSDEIRRFGIDSPKGGILLTESGYLMLVKSFTDELAWQVQRDLVNNYFRKSEINLYQGMSKELQAIFILDEKTQKQDERISRLENTMTIDYSQQEILNNLAKKTVVQALGGKDAPAYREFNKKAFSTIWRDFKRIMQVNSYRNTAVKEFERAIEFIKNWKPNRELQLIIQGANSELILDVE